MIRLVPVYIPRDPSRPMPRMWLIFFNDGPGAAWWGKFFRAGFRHVSAASWYDDQQRWVYYNPTRRGTVIELYASHEFDARLGQLAYSSAAIVRIASSYDRTSTPATWHCVGAIKHLLGIRGRAFTPYSLFRHLLALGAEAVEVPASDRSIQLESTAATG